MSATRDHMKTKQGVGGDSASWDGDSGDGAPSLLGGEMDFKHSCVIENPTTKG